VIRTQQILQKQHAATEKANASLVSNSKLIIAQHRELENLAKDKLIAAVKRLVAHKKNQLSETVTTACHKPQLLIAFRKQACTNLSDKIISASRNYLLHRDRELHYQDSFSRMMDPVNILKKGFALLYREEKILTGGATIQTGEKLTVRLQDSLLTITVNDKTTNDGKETNL
jgi:exodeoxyribonuclease VII large subunit